MTIDLMLDPSTHDLPIPSGANNFDIPLATGIDQIAQNLNIRLRFFLGEWYLNTLVGIPYYQYFFIKNPNQIQVETFLKNEINGTPGVTEITQFASNYDGPTRSFEVEFTASTVAGTTTIEVQLP
jgi:hypothetical protein